MYNTEVSLKYKEIDHSDIQNMAYLKAKLKHAVFGEDISCGWFFIILAEKHNFRITNVNQMCEYIFLSGLSAYRSPDTSILR